jgi:hypothetical protein
MRWSRAVHHLEELTYVCADMARRPATIFPLRVTALWTFGEVLSSRGDLDCPGVVLADDLPTGDVPWLCAPAGAEHWSHAAGLSHKPLAATWRTSRAPLWNHHIRSPLLIWDESGGAAAALPALRAGTAESLRLPEPTPAQMASRLEAELSMSLQALEATTAAYGQRRFSPGKKEAVADALWHASEGYLDVLAAAR